MRRRVLLEMLLVKYCSLLVPPLRSCRVQSDVCEGKDYGRFDAKKKSVDRITRHVNRSAPFDTSCRPVREMSTKRKS